MRALLYCSLEISIGFQRRIPIRVPDVTTKPIVGGGGNIVANVFVLGQRLDFATFNTDDSIPTKDDVDESGNHVTLQRIADSRKTNRDEWLGFHRDARSSDHS